MKATYINSYAHAQRVGIKPFDSLISTVAIPGKKPKIVAFRGSHTFLIKNCSRPYSARNKNISNELTPVVAGYN